MNRLEKWIVGTAFLYSGCYIIFILVLVLLVRPSRVDDITPFVVLHILAMLACVTALVVTLRDLYLRDFVRKNDKLTWGLLILLTGGIGWFVYIVKHAFKPRMNALQTRRDSGTRDLSM